MWAFMDIIPDISYNVLTEYTTFTNYLLIVDAYSRITKRFGMENITTEEVIYRLDMFQEIFGKVDEFYGGIWR